MNISPLVGVEVACATPEKQRSVRLDVPAGTTARQAVLVSGLQTEFPELDLARLSLGIFGHVVADDCVLRPGDRVEIYRPLPREPVETRRLQAYREKTRADSGGKQGGQRR